MKRILLVFLVLALSCKNETKNEVTTDAEIDISEEIAYASFGDKISDADAISASEMMAKFKSMTVEDTLQVKTVGKIVDVCSKKGCWMKLDMGNDDIVRVTFKDYGFFVPTDADGEVIINGKAYVSETSVDDLKHFAEDAGKTQEEIDAITEPEFTYSFEADGVLLKG
ncbi:MAG: DUF4920 domain-containing protein [Bacteroidota bacterium]